MKQPNEHSSSTIALPMRNGYRIIKCSDIVRCEAAGNYTRFFLVDGQVFSICKRLKEVEGMLSGDGFCRIHHSHLVNLGRVEMWVREGLVLVDGAKVPVAKSKRNELKGRLI